MANRAYLYVSDNDDSDDSEYGASLDRSLALPYCDSRHAIPFAWFFFFMPDDVRVRAPFALADIHLVSPKNVAVSRFERRIPLLFSITRNRYDSDTWVHRFLVWVRKWEGRYLCLDTSEILEEGAAKHLADCVEFLRSFDQTPPDPEQILKHADRVSAGLYTSSYNMSEAERFECSLVGFCYRCEEPVPPNNPTT